MMLLLFLPYALLEPFSSDTNDDTAMNLIAAGAFGEKSQYLVYSNVIYGYLLKGLYLLLPSVNWYLWIALLCNVLSAAVLGAVLAYFLEYRYLSFSLVILHFYIAGEFYQSIQYTRNAYLYAICGIILLVMATIVDVYRVMVAIAGGGMLLLSILVRRECVVPVIPFLALLLIRQFLRKRERIRGVMGALLGTLLVGGVFVTADEILFRKSAEGKEYFEYHLNAIAPILDNEVNASYSYDPETIDLEVTDLMLLNEYHYADFDYFTPERLKGLQEKNQTLDVFERFGVLADVLRKINRFPAVPDYVYLNPGVHSWLNYLERGMSWNALADVILLVCAVYLFVNKKLERREGVWILLFLCCMLFDLLAIIYGTGHTPRRATIGPRMCFELFTAFVLIEGRKESAGGQKKKTKKGCLLALCMAFLLVTSIRIMNRMTIPEQTETGIVLEELRNIDGEYYVLDAMLLWGERLGITDLRTLNRKNYKDYFERFVLSGGWLAETPYARRYMQERGISAPMTELATDPHFHYVVRSWTAERLVPLLADYLQRQCRREIAPRAVYAGNDVYIVDFCGTSVP